MDVSRYPKLAQRLCREIEEHRVLANWLYIFPLVEQLRAKESKLNVLCDFYFYEAKFEQLLLSLYHGELRPGDDILTLTPECQKSLERAMEMFRKVHHDCTRSGLANEAWCEDVKVLSKLLLCKARFLTVQSSEQFGQLVHNLEDDANLDKIVASRLVMSGPSPAATVGTAPGQLINLNSSAIARLQPHESRMYRVIAEAYMLKAIAMEKSTPASTSRFKRIEYEEKVNAAYNVAADLSYIYLQLLSQRLLTVSLPAVMGAIGGVGGVAAPGGGAAGVAGQPAGGSTTAGSAATSASGAYNFPGAAYTAGGGAGGASGSNIPSPAYQTAMLAGVYPTQQSMHEKLVGVILETGLLKGPQLLLLHSQPLWAISQLRDNLHYVQPAPAQLLRLEMLVTLAELLLRRAFGKHFISARQTATMLLAHQRTNTAATNVQQPFSAATPQLMPESSAAGTKLLPIVTAGPAGGARRRPEIYAAHNMFLPITSFEEVLLLLLLSEAVCYQINPMINNAALNATAPSSLAASNAATTTRTSANSGVTADHGHHHLHHHNKHEHNVTTTTTHVDKSATSPQPPAASPAGGGTSSLLILPEAAPAPMNILEDILTTNEACTEYAQITCDMLNLWLAHNDLHPLLIPCIERAIRASTALSEGLRRKRAQALHANGYARQAELFYDALFTQPPVQGQTGAARDDAVPPAVVARLQPHAFMSGRHSTGGFKGAAANAGNTAGNSQLELLDDTFGYNSMDRRELLLMRAVNLIESHLNVEAGIDIAQQLLDELLFDTSVMVADNATATTNNEDGGRRAPSAALVGINSDTNAPITTTKRQQQQQRRSNNIEKSTDYKRAQSTPAVAREQYRSTVVTSVAPNVAQPRRPRLSMSALDRALFVKAKILQGIGWAYRAKLRNVAYKRRQFEDRAVQAFHKAVEMDRDDPFVHFQLAYQYCLSRQMDAAFSHIKLSLTLDPNFLHAIHLFALILSGQKQYHRALQLLDEKTYGVRDVNISLTRIKLEALCRGPEVALDSCRALLHQWKELYEGDFAFTSVYAGLMGGGGGGAGGVGGGAGQQQTQTGSSRVSASHFYYHDNIIGGDDFDNDMPNAITTGNGPTTGGGGGGGGNITTAGGASTLTSTSGHLMMPYVATGGSISNAGATSGGTTSGPGSVVGGTIGRAQRRSHTPKPGGPASIISGVATSNNTSTIAANAAHDASADIEDFTASVVGADGVGTAAASAIGQYSAIMGGGGGGNGSDYASTAGGYGGGGGGGSLAAVNAARYGFSAPGVMSQILILSEMADLYVKAGKIGDAWQSLVVGEQLRFGSYLLMHLRGVLNAELGDFEEARHSLQHALAINAWHVPSLVKLGQLAHAVFDDRQLAEKCFRDAIHADPFAHEAWCGLGTLAEEQDDFATAAFYFDEAQKYMRTEPVRSVTFVPRNYSQRFSNA